NKVYRYPDFGVCLYQDNGCDSLDDHIARGCVASSNSTEFGLSTAEYRGQELSPTDGVWIPDTTEETEKRQSIDVDPRFTGTEKKYCVLFNMSTIEHELGEERAQENYLDYTNLRMAWYPSGSKENDSNTCTTDLANRKPHSTAVVIHLFDEVTGTIANGFQVAYTCRTNTSDTHMFTDIALALTETKKLDGTKERSYRADTIFPTRTTVTKWARISQILHGLMRL
ncbi:unnamed protein product, partial [Ectocarpus sp. 8 AP-2014]